MKPLKPLEEHNRERSNQYFDDWIGKPRPNGLACPKCGKELRDSNPSITLTSNPPKKDVACGACDYTGYRYA